MLFSFCHPFTDWLFPRRCFLCQEDIPCEEICDSCLSFCSVFSNTVLQYRENPCALFFYEMTIKELIKGIKFNKNRLYTYLLLKIIKKQFFNSNLFFQVKLFSPQAIVYVPSHFMTNIFRNVELSFLFAQALSKQLKIPIRSMLKKINFKERQALRAKKADRITAIKNSFALRKDCPKYNKILLVDDITTTGATFLECRRVLKKRCSKIICLAIAKTP